MPTLFITRGLPGSGKTTLAVKWVARDPSGRARVNRDDLRAMMHSSLFIPGHTEKQILAARDTTITALLGAGVDVFCDDTNLPQRTVRDLMRLAARCGADFAVYDLTHVPVEECIVRDAARPRPVGEEVIRSQHLRFLRGRPTPLPLPEAARPVDATLQPYTPPEGAPRAVLLDVDGTAALMNGRSPYDWGRVGEDLPNMPVIEAARALHAAGNVIVVMSGRSDSCRDATTAWLDAHLGVPYVGPFMRADGDTRPDSVVKAELFDAYVRDHYDVRIVLDDRDQVVKTWRALGLTCFQVAPGAF